MLSESTLPIKMYYIQNFIIIKIKYNRSVFTKLMNSNIIILFKRRTSQDLSFEIQPLPSCHSSTISSIFAHHELWDATDKGLTSLSFLLKVDIDRGNIIESLKNRFSSFGINLLFIVRWWGVVTIRLTNHTLFSV